MRREFFIDAYLIGSQAHELVLLHQVYFVHKQPGYCVERVRALLTILLTSMRLLVG